jgi:hypothetical protein
MSFLPSTQHLFNSHYMFRPQRVIFRCYKHMVLKLHHKSLTFSSLRIVPCVGFEPTIPAYERAKTVHALDRTATVTGNI